MSSNLREKFSKIIENITKQSNFSKFDSSSFNDDIATMTEWSPLKRGGASFRTAKLVKIDSYKYIIKSSPEILVFGSIFFLIGLGLICFQANLLLNDKLEFGSLIATSFVGIMFIGVAIAVILFSLKTIVLDRGRRNIRVKDGTMLSFSDIHALQIIKERVQSKKSSYLSYELNLVLKDSSRYNLMDHGKMSVIRSDAADLAIFLAVPLWDSTEADY